MFVAVSLPRTLSRFESARVLVLDLTEATSIDFDGCAHIPASGVRAVARSAIRRTNFEDLMLMTLMVILLSAQKVTE